jgi:hypothetical protein
VNSGTPVLLPFLSFRGRLFILDFQDKLNFPSHDKGVGNAGTRSC